VPHTCKPSYLGFGDWENHHLRPAQAKKFERPHFYQWPEQLHKPVSQYK
jgi:hypothetical protein